MCGIFGILLNNNDNNIFKLIIDGLIQLQNRGYDSSGLSVIKKNNFEIYKSISTDKDSSISKLQDITSDRYDNDIYNGIGHNRWATHGIKNTTNAHPHVSNDNLFSIVHNGIIENYSDIKKMLQMNNYIFYSETDTEVIVNLLSYNYKRINNIYFAIKETITILRGTYVLVIQFLHEPYKLFCVRNGLSLLVGQNDKYTIVTSEQSGFCNLINNYIILNNDDICVIEKTENIINIKTNEEYKIRNINILYNELTPSPYNHWTLKEINEQSLVVLNSIKNGGRIKNGSEVKLRGLDENIDVLKEINNIIILGCGTSYFAGLYGMYYLKTICNLNTVQTFEGSEFDEYDIPKIGRTVFILISQSGETKDLHRCIEIAKKNNIITIGVINVVDSLIARDVDCGIYCNAGKEVGVASTKAFMSQVVCLSLITIWFAQIHNINEYKRINMITDLYNLSNDVKNTLNICNYKIKELSNKIYNNNMFLLGKGTDEYIAKEGSLKIKEITYIHSEGYSASSLKHGPFALLDNNFPVIIFNLDQTNKSKIINCMNEVKSRNAPIIFITNDNNMLIENLFELIIIPENNTYSSLLGIIPIQLLAYYMAINKNINPDKPKNLAKVVTVE